MPGKLTGLNSTCPLSSSFLPLAHFSLFPQIWGRQPTRWWSSAAGSANSRRPWNPESQCELEIMSKYFRLVSKYEKQIMISWQPASRKRWKCCERKKAFERKPQLTVSLEDLQWHNVGKNWETYAWKSLRSWRPRWGRHQGHGLEMERPIWIAPGKMYIIVIWENGI